MSLHCSWHGVSLGVGGRAQGPSRPVESRETTRAAQTLNESGQSHGETGPAVWGPRRSQGGRPAPRQAVAALTRKPRPSRFGSFEIFKPADESTGRAGPSVGRNDIRVQMLDYVVGTFYPEIQAAHAGDSVQRNAAFFREVRAPAGPPAEGACPAPAHLGCTCRGCGGAQFTPWQVGGRSLCLVGLHVSVSGAERGPCGCPSACPSALSCTRGTA